MSRMLVAVGMSWLVFVEACATPDELDPMVSMGLRSESSGASHAPGRIIVSHWQTSFVSLQAASAPTYLDQSLSLARELGSYTGLYRLPDGADPVAVVDALTATGEYQAVDLDYRRTIQSTVNDPFRGFQWHLDNVNAEAAWTISKGAGITVAVLDTGCAENADGLHAVASGEYDFVNDDGDASDDHGHGTHVANIVAQSSNNNTGTAGLAYEASILPIKVLNDQGVGYDSELIAGVNRAVAQGADVINMSLSGSGYSGSLKAAIDAAWGAGVLLTCSTGNDGQSSVKYPARYENCVGVSATNFSNELASYSNYGDGVDIAAPGGDATLDQNGDGYGDGLLQESFDALGNWGYYFLEGTSMSAPQVAAAAAMLMAKGASNVDALRCIEDNAQDIGAATYFGAGLLRPDLALQAWQAHQCGNAPVCLPRNDSCSQDSQCCSGICRPNKKCD